MNELQIVVLTEENVDELDEALWGRPGMLRELYEDGAKYDAEVHFAYDEGAYAYYLLSHQAKATAGVDIVAMIQEQLFIKIKQYHLEAAMKGPIF